MLSLFLWAQLGIVVAKPPTDSAYTTVALRRMVASAAAANKVPPSALRSYQSHIETELSLILRDTLGREHTAEVEQLATAATWERGGRYELHVVGYRSQSVGVPYSTLSIVRAWTVPSLYGDRLSLGAYFARSRTGDTLIAVHPFAVDRDSFYRFSGGDTVATLRVGSRSIPIARIRVRPNFHGATRLGAFDGEIDLDAERDQIVRMRGQFVVGREGKSKRDALARAMGVVGVAYVEFVNAEVEGKYWLPAFQRTEFQANFPLLGQTRPIFRLVSSIGDIAVNDTGTTVGTDSLGVSHLVVSWAKGDSASSYKQWQHDIGTQSSSVHSDDFEDMAPDVWRVDGPPRLRLFPTATSRMIRFNRVEGLFTGVAPSVDFRSVAPGLSVGGYVGLAWAEQTVRGGVFATRSRGQSIWGVRGERALASTNDFALPLDDDPGFAALLGSIDNYDYVDRRRALISLTRILGAVDVGLATVQLGVAEDRAERARLSHGAFSGPSGFRANRGAANGSYVLSILDLEFHPNVTGDFVQPGVGARLHHEAGSGELDWQRSELALSGRKYWGPVSIALHADAGIVLGQHPPPQTLFELGGNAVLPGYEYKQFAGDRAALFRSFASYRFSVLRRPMHFWRNYFIPGFGPGLAVSAQGGWTEVSSVGARQAVAALGDEWSATPVSQATNGVRATVGAGITLFSDLMHLGFARPVDHAAPWKFVAGFGAMF
jgi:hypothetical protein